ncbi:MAG: hypothetical protein RBU37_28275 [Myxococcota bacterium]|jgi:hypothetical protein|nr:hypothetical protein [Myxococcota bacterium]
MSVNSTPMMPSSQKLGNWDKRPINKNFGEQAKRPIDKNFGEQAKRPIDKKYPGVGRPRTLGQGVQSLTVFHLIAMRKSNARPTPLRGPQRNTSASFQALRAALTDMVQT